MLLGKYHIVIFKEGVSGSRNLRMRGWFGFFVFVLVSALVACNIWLLKAWFNATALQENLVNAERQIDEQRRGLVNLAERLDAASRDLQRVQRFDAKLRLMMNMEKDPREVGNDGLADFSRSYLPLHRQELAVRKMQEYLARLSEAARLEEVRQQDLLRALRDKHDVLASMPSIWPVVGFVSSTFGRRVSPLSGRGADFHKGLDISNRVGTPVVAPAEGTVSFAAPDGAYGNSVEINHGNGISTKYAHLQRWTVQPGQWVKRGQVIGYVGMSGRTTGPHLHYEVHLHGAPVNPMRYILE
ncbi:MAG: peptidoglycan DD-metalloendopeptidase family protein [Desulfovibrio sp.]|jgi:murein DD-endopeptidase MepM/ murein hydrolase activator NlpD|nr:peptidoglycan DD-metalloendopeptidase family protein [Desulfovibrio sp.]